MVEQMTTTAAEMVPKISAAKQGPCQDRMSESGPSGGPAEWQASRGPAERRMSGGQAENRTGNRRTGDSVGCCGRHRRQANWSFHWRTGEQKIPSPTVARIQENRRFCQQLWPLLGNQVTWVCLLVSLTDRPKTQEEPLWSLQDKQTIWELTPLLRYKW